MRWKRTQSLDGKTFTSHFPVGRLDALFWDSEGYVLGIFVTGYRGLKKYCDVLRNELGLLRNECGTCRTPSLQPGPGAFRLPSFWTPQ